MRNPETKEQAEEMVLELEEKVSVPDLAQEQIDEISADIERIREWIEGQ